MPTPEPRRDAIRVMVVDDHPMIRLGLKAMIEAEDDFVLAGEASDGADAVAQAAAMAPDVVLMDLVMPRMDGVAATEAMRRAVPDARVVILTSLVDAAQIKRAIEAGACGYVLKDASSQELVTVIRSAHGGRRVLAPAVTDALVAATQQATPGADLTQRERELLALMARGMSNQDIAEALGIAVPTVKFHITNILGKLGCDNRTEAVLLAIRHKLVPPA